MAELKPVEIRESRLGVIRELWRKLPWGYLMMFAVNV